MRVDLLPTTEGAAIARLNEECGEVVKAIGKLWRFGPYPMDGLTGKQYDNVRDILNEMVDLEHAIHEARPWLLKLISPSS